MELVPITRSSEDFREIWPIYEASFPEDERRTLAQQEALFGNRSYRLLGGKSGGRLEGFISYWMLPSFHFIEHFAVHEGSRGRGLGAAMLRAFVEGKPLVLMEVEKPESGIQKRRVSFYEKAGFRTNSFDYVQPPYGPGKRPVHMLLMSRPGPLPIDDLVSMRAAIHGQVYGLEAPLI